MKCTPQNTTWSDSTFFGLTGEFERVTDKVGHLEDFGSLIVMGQNDRVVLLLEPFDVVNPLRILGTRLGRVAAVELR
jgi:hypothetical protein